MEKTIIELEGMSFGAGHGCFEIEKVVGGRFEVDIALTLDASRAIVADDLSGTVDYMAVYALVKEEMAAPSKLIEHVAGRIAARIKERFPQVEKVRVKLSKMAPPLGGKIEKVSVTLSL